ncbi:MAG TPA: tryptophan 7-halogenase [Thermoanaerobaculia bacterium]|nr:tryptophan 7-halogenase [Thermoanaerobaculia bacterium]
MSTDKYDLIVVGGGPTGASLASFTAIAGHRVLLLERETFPRHQIGESLLPATIHGICRMLGVLDKVERRGFPRKNGGTFRWGKNPEPWTFRFSRQENDPYGYAYQVERSVFDEILLDRARELGVDVRERHDTLSAIVEDGRVAGVVYADGEGRQHEARAPFVVDASGNRSHLWQGVGERVYSEFFKNVALYGYFEHGRRLPAPNQGNILSAAFSDGWFWYIPLSDTLTSVGAVVSQEAANEIRDGEEKALERYIGRCGIIADYLSGARRVTDGPYGSLRIRKDYSYCMNRFSRPGMLLAGDAACFIDPVFSSGVHLGTYSALLAARSIITLLGGTSGLTEEECFTEYEDRYRREFGRFYQFLLAFYDVHQDEESYYWQARKILNTEERGNESFVRLVAGLSASDEPLFGGSQGFFDARQGFGSWFAQNVLPPEAGGAAALPPPPPVPPANGPETFDPAQFMLGFNKEIASLQLLALRPGRRTSERPLRKGGLVPTADGLRWQAA